jgi:uncharacterized membrane protein YccC
MKHFNRTFKSFLCLIGLLAVVKLLATYPLMTVLPSFALVFALCYAIGVLFV